jgi:hypothetical protein
MQFRDFGRQTEEEEEETNITNLKSISAYKYNNANSLCKLSYWSCYSGQQFIILTAKESK